MESRNNKKPFYNKTEKSKDFSAKKPFFVKKTEGEAKFPKKPFFTKSKFGEKAGAKPKFDKGAKSFRPRPKFVPNKPSDTSWGRVSSWYDEMLKDDDSYQQKVIEPNLLRVVDAKKGEKILDLGSGQGHFSRLFAKAGAEVVGLEISEELIALAKKYDTKNVYYIAGKADEALNFKKEEFDKVTVVLALQNMKNMVKVVEEVARVLKPQGKFFLVLNHPAFRVPQETDWGFDEKRKEQFRKVFSYMTPKEVPIIMDPGKTGKEKTFSYHRPLQDYFKAFAKNGLAVTRLEEWISHKTSAEGPKKIAEDSARKEIPIFMLLEVKKV